MMIQEKEISNINELLSCQNDDNENVLNCIVKRKDKTTDRDYTIIYIIGIQKVIFATDLQDNQKKEILSRLISDLTASNQNVGTLLFEQVPNAFLFQMFFSLHNLGIDVEPLIRSVDLNLFENGLTNLQVLGDFTDQKFIDNLLFFYKKLDKNRYQKALHDISIELATVNNVDACEKLIEKIKDGKSKSEVLVLLAWLYLKLGETHKALELVEISEDKALLLSNISKFLLENNCYDEVLNLLKSNDDPIIKFEFLLRIIHYHIDQNDFKVLDILLDQATEQSRKIRDFYIKAICFSKLAEVEMRMCRDQGMRIHIGDALFIIENQLNFKTGCLAFNDLFTRLVIGEKYELADDLLSKRWAGMTCSGQIEFDGNHTTDVNHTILSILKLIDELVREDSGKIEKNNKAEIERLYGCTLTALMFLRDISGQDYLLHEIALSYSKHGFYSEASEIRNNIDDTDYKNHLRAMIPLYAIGNGNYEKALELVESIDIHSIKVETQLTIVPILQKNGYQTEALEFLKNWALYKLRQNQY